MVNSRFPGIELDQPSSSQNGEGDNPTAEAENEVLDTIGRAKMPQDHEIGQPSVIMFLF